MGQEHTYKVPMEMFLENRTKLMTNLKKEQAAPQTLTTNGHKYHQSVVILQGGVSPTRYDTDFEPIFRQESYFWWLSGVKEPDCWLALTSTSTGDDDDGSKFNYTLFIPKLPAEYATIMGRIKTPEEWKTQYEVDEVLFTSDLESYLETLTSPPETKSTIYLMEGLNTDSDMTYQPPKRIADNATKIENVHCTINSKTLFPVFVECRVIKSERELKLLEFVSQLTSFAHCYVMRNIKPGNYEYQAESLFRHYTYYNYGSRLQAYTSICGCGPNAATLHYGHAGEPNSRLIGEDDNCLFDMGAEYQCYASDITCSFPANGKFSHKYKPIYEAVLKAQIAVYNIAKPGTSWVDCHKAAEMKILEALCEIGIVVKGNKSIEELVEMRLGAVFMPHGLGHFIGIDTHDVGGYLSGRGPERSVKPGLRKLRTARILQTNMVLTVEPGCYFIDWLIDEALADSQLSSHLNKDRLEEYRGYGGVRLEDVCMISENEGLINLTVCPRTPAEVEHVMSGGNWPPTKDEAPELRRKNLTATGLVGQPSPPSK